MTAQLTALRASYEPAALDVEIDEQIGKLDSIVGLALGLSAADVGAIQKDMTGDPFLGRVRPRYPFRQPRQYGRRVNLERENRYATV